MRQSPPTSEYYSEMDVVTISEKAQHIASQASVTTGVGTFAIGTWSANEVAAIGGFLIAVATFALNWYFQWRNFKLRQRVARKKLDLSQEIREEELKK